MVIKEQLKYLKEIVIDLLIHIQVQGSKIKDLEESKDQFWKCFQDEKDKKQIPGVYFSKAEKQSGTNRIYHAEGLIKQLSIKHEGRNTWLMNYGVSKEAVKLREKRNLKFDEQTKSAETTKS